MMKTFKVCINSIEAAKTFVNIVSKAEYNVDLMSEHYVVDAKSIMGIFMLDLSKDITLRTHSDDCDELVEMLKDFII